MSATGCNLRKSFRSLRPFLILALLLASARAHASIGLVIGEPFGGFGTMLPVGHASIYLDHICPETPTHLRLCRPGESGVVISRYHDLTASGLDFLATPAFSFFYGVDTPEQVPIFITPALRDSIRMAYRNAHYRDVVPDPLPTRIENDSALHFKDGEDWQESIGSAFDRRLFIYQLDTTPEQDQAILDYVNSLPNKRRYTLARHNCADFAANIMRIVLPHQPRSPLHRTFAVDYDITTPKAIARELDAWGKTHPELHFAVYEVPQIPGSTRRSRPLRSCAELFVTTKRYFFTLLVIAPEWIVPDTIAYAAKGRWKPGLDATVVSPAVWPPVPTQPEPSDSIASQPSEAPSQPSSGGNF
jgi:hypothetical protein